MSKIQNLLCNSFKHINASFSPEDQITWNTLEVDRGKQLTLQKKIEETIEEVREDIKNSGGTGIDILTQNEYLRIFFEFRLIAKYFAGEFRLKCFRWNDWVKDEFYQILDLFIEKWYFSYVYVGWGDDLLELDKKIFYANSQNSGQKDIYRNCRFRLYTKSGDKFYSILAGNLVDSDLVHEGRLVRCSLDEGTMWLYWWHILLEHLGGIKRCLTAWTAISKQITMENFGDDEKKKVEEQILNNDTVFFKPMATEDLGEETFCEPMKFMDANDVSHMFGMLYDYTERQAAKMGYVFKPANLKKERTNSGENYALNKTIANMQTLMLTKLNTCLWNMRKTFFQGWHRVIPKEMSFVLSNQAWATGLPNNLEEGKEQGWIRKGQPDFKNKNNFQNAS